MTIGDKNYAEQFVLGQLYLRALEAQGFKVNITQNIGPTSVVLGSLKDHTLAMYPEYLNVVDSTLAHDRHPFRTLKTADAAGEAWAERHGLRLLTPTPFSDTTGVAVTDAYAVNNHLHSLGDLLNVANTLTIGGAVQFKTNHSGVHALEHGYGVQRRRSLPWRSATSTPRWTRMRSRLRSSTRPTESSRPATTRCSTIPRTSSATATSSR